ncbi:type IIA topoisomerase, A subunit [Chryseobacterium phage MA9V-2]|nr:type IIA topoisomerase, A subunit [Chryseobacterium phage MA9V-2]
MAKRKNVAEASEFELTEFNDQINITTLLNTDYKAYAGYTVFNRAIPSLADGFKTVQRKIMYTALGELKGNKPIKVAALGGFVMAKSHYAHGDASLESAIVTMGQGFKQSLPYFLPDSDFGEIYTPQAGAARYISMYKSDVFDLLMKDSNQLIKQYAEGDEIEPTHYLPIIPTVLINSTEGMAVGYSSNIINKNPLGLIDACIDYVKTGKLDDSLELIPYFQGAIGRYVNYTNHVGDSRFEHYGLWEQVNPKMLRVTGLPAGTTLEKFEEHLNSLIDVGQIFDWVNRSENNKINYEVHFDKNVLADIIKKGTVLNVLKLFTRLQVDNLTMLDIDGKVKRFDNVAQVIRRFIDWRMPYVETRRQLKIDEINKKIKAANDKLKFIELVQAGKIDVKSFVSRADAAEKLSKFDLPVEMVDIKIYSISKEEVDKLKKSIVDLLKELSYYEKLTAKKMYLTDLTDLLKAVEAKGYQRDECEYIVDKVWQAQLAQQ